MLQARFYLSVDPGVYTGISVIKVSNERVSVLRQRVLSMDAISGAGALNRCFREFLREFPITRVVVEEFTLIKKIRKTVRQKIAWDHAYSVQIETMALASLYALRCFLVKPDYTGRITTRYRSSMQAHMNKPLSIYNRHVVDTIVFVMKVEGLLKPFWLNFKVEEESDLDIINLEEAILTDEVGRHVAAGRIKVMTGPFEGLMKLRDFCPEIANEQFLGHLEVVSA